MKAVLSELSYGMKILLHFFLSLSNAVSLSLFFFFLLSHTNNVVRILALAVISVRDALPTLLPMANSQSQLNSHYHATFWFFFFIAHVI